MKSTNRNTGRNRDRDMDRKRCGCGKRTSGREKREEKNSLGQLLLRLGTVFSFLIFTAVPVLAATGSSSGAAVIETGFATLLDIVKALVTAIGTIVLLWGLFEWGTSLQSPNGAEQSNAFKRIGGGLVMVLAPQLISLFV